jgi:signal peptidase I
MDHAATAQSQSGVTVSRSSIREVVQILVVVVIAAVLLKSFVLGAVYVPTTSMAPTLLAGDYVLVNKLAYSALMPSSARAVKRGDVILFEDPTTAGAEARYLVKRCAASSGETVDVPEVGDVRVPKTGDVIPLTAGGFSTWSGFIEREGHRVEIDAMGNVRIDGFIRERYTVERNYLFVLGDNRDHSYDSTVWGFLPEENVIGRALMVYWSAKPEGGMRWGRMLTVVR